MARLVHIWLVAAVVMVVAACGGPAASVASNAPATSPTLASQMSAKLEHCWAEGADGTVTNHSGTTVDVFVSIHYVNADGTVVDDDLDAVNGLGPGQTGSWTSAVRQHPNLGQCVVSIDSAIQP